MLFKNTKLSFNKLIYKIKNKKIFNFESDIQNIFVRFVLSTGFSSTFLPLTITCFRNIVNIKRKI